MIGARIEGATRVLGEAQGYLPLFVRDGEAPCGAHEITMAFEPTPEELAALLAGAKVHLTLLCFTPPPMRVTVGEAPE
jgi:hypothetical protein